VARQDGELIDEPSVMELEELKIKEAVS
jgi:hypothetical protein